MIASIPLAVLAALLAAVVTQRCIVIGAHVSPRRFAGQHGPARWHGFAFSYIALAAASWFAVLDVWHNGGTAADWGFLLSSAGLVLFDPRRTK